VQAAAVSVYESTRAGRDQLAQRRDSVLARHVGSTSLP
jgi:hypothetical protein